MFHRKWAASLAIAVFDDPPAVDPSKTPPVAKTTFTQDEVNAIMKTEREKLEKKFETVSSTLKLTEDQKKTLATQLEEARNEGLTKTEQLARELDKTKKEMEVKITDNAKRAEMWESQYKSTLIDNSLTSASVTNKAFNPSQITAILGNRARVVETLDSEGKPTGKFGVKVKIDTKDKENKPITLDLDADGAVKHLSDTPEFANLFQGKHVPGLGGSNGSGNSTTTLDLKNLSHEDYVKNRDAILKQGTAKK